MQYANKQQGFDGFISAERLLHALQLYTDEAADTCPAVCELRRYYLLWRAPHPLAALKSSGPSECGILQLGYLLFVPIRC